MTPDDQEVTEHQLSLRRDSRRVSAIATTRVIRLSFPDGARRDVVAAELWSLTDELVTADGEIPHAVATAAELRLAMKASDGEIPLTELQAHALRALLKQAPA